MAPRKQASGGDELTLEEEALIRQWIEYRHVVLNRLGGSPNALGNVMQVNVINICSTINYKH